MTIYNNLILERLRPLVGLKGWDYCILWKLIEDQSHQRFIEWIGCCCSGVDEDTRNGGQELLFPVFQCRDTMQHSRTSSSCDILAGFPSSIPLNSGFYAETIMSKQPCWLNWSSNNRDSSVMLERNGTRVLVPTAGGLMIELFDSKDVSEDQNVIDFITAQCNIWRENDSLISASNTSNTNTPVLSPSMASLDPHDVNLPYDITAERIRLCASESSSPLNFLQHVTSYNPDNRMKNSPSACTHQGNFSEYSMDQPLENMEQQGNRDDHDSVKPADHSGSDCSDQTDENTNYKRRTGKEPQSKNLVAERKRRKKLNEKLYKLRSLVPNISKMDKASILKDAIDYVKDLQRQVKELQDVLEDDSDNAGGGKRTFNNISVDHNIYQSDNQNQNAFSTANKTESDKPRNGFHDSDHHNSTDKGQQQMEPQVGVTQLDGNEFFVTVFCEQKPEGFVRLMEALDTLGLEVTNANVTSFRSIVSNVFKVEKRDSEILQADEVRDSLLEITWNPTKGCSPEMAKTARNDGAFDYDQENKHNYHNHLHNYHDSTCHLQHLYD